MVWILMLLAAGDAVVISDIFRPRRMGGCYRRGLNLLAFRIHGGLQRLCRHRCCHQTCELKPTGQSESPWKLDLSGMLHQSH